MVTGYDGFMRPPASVAVYLGTPVARKQWQGVEQTLNFLYVHFIVRIAIGSYVRSALNAH